MKFILFCGGAISWVSWGHCPQQTGISGSWLHLTSTSTCALELTRDWDPPDFKTPQLQDVKIPLLQKCKTPWLLNAITAGFPQYMALSLFNSVDPKIKDSSTLNYSRTTNGCQDCQTAITEYCSTAPCQAGVRRGLGPCMLRAYWLYWLDRTAFRVQYCTVLYCTHNTEEELKKKTLFN